MHPERSGAPGAREVRSASPEVAPLKWAKPPRQARSQRTLERILDSAEEIVAERGVHALTVSEVVRRARSSVGAFYARFTDKGSLLRSMHERSCEEAIATADLALDPRRWQRLDIHDSIREIIRFVVQLCAERRGLIVAFIAAIGTDSGYAERRARLSDEIAHRLHLFLMARRDEIAHPDPELAAHVAVRMILATIETEAIVQRATPAPARGLDGDRLAEELTYAMVAYLGIPLSRRRAAFD